MVSNPSIGIVIVNYNGAKFQNDCIKSILANDYSNYKIIIVDNNSTDDSMVLLEELNDYRIIKIKLNDNFGVAYGNNVGINKSIELGCEYTMILNNDTILKENLISNLLKISNDYLVIVPKIYFYGTTKIWYGGGKFIYSKCVNKHLYYGKNDTSMIKYHDWYSYAPTCCMLVNNNVFKLVGLMDEKYFVYFDDTDFCFRLKIRGIKIGFAKDALLYHKVSMSTGGNKSKIGLYYENRNRFYFRKKFKRYFSFLSLMYLIFSRYVKYFFGVIKKDNRIVIKKAIQDYKNGKMGRCDEI